ncbi:MAG: hypothetical protein IJS88_04970 [Alphaproteobacteria bacterium]|nr:hypothetical protein [Alphaproteobacteria bacterium]
MDILFNYGNIIFWIGLLIVFFLCGCEFFFNDMNIAFTKYRPFTFDGHPQLQKACRALFVLSVALALFAKSGANWRNSSDYFINLMVVLLIYYVVCYSCTICLLWMLSVLYKFVRLFIAVVLYLFHDIIA